MATPSPGTRLENTAAERIPSFRIRLETSSVGMRTTYPEERKSLRIVPMGVSEPFGTLYFQQESIALSAGQSWFVQQPVLVSPLSFETE